MTALNLDTAAPPGTDGLSMIMKAVIGGGFTILLLLVGWNYSEAKDSREDIKIAIQRVQDAQTGQGTRISVNEEAIRNIRESLLRIEAKIDKLSMR